MRGDFSESAALWSERTSPDMWSLLALLIAICGLLASPNASDPLVPEIAQKLVEDPEGYYEAAKSWTEKYASTSQIPDDETLRFPDDQPNIVDAQVSTEAKIVEHIIGVEASPSINQTYLRTNYDDIFVDDWVTVSAQSKRHFIHISPPGTSNKPVDQTEASRSDLERVIDSLLSRDASQNKVRLMTGQTLSKMEQWRMTREIRLALEAWMHKDFSSRGVDEIAPLDRLSETRVRRLIADSALRRSSPDGQPESSVTQYFRILRRTFAIAQVRKPGAHTASITPSSSSRSSSSAEYSKTPTSGSLVSLAVRKSTSNNLHRPARVDSNRQPRAYPATYTSPRQHTSFTSINTPRYHPYSQRINHDAVYEARVKSTRHYAFQNAERTHMSYYEQYKPHTHTSYYELYKSRQERDESPPARRRRSATSTPTRPTRPISSKSKITDPKATDADARKHRIPAGYSLKNWDPNEEPIMLLGSVFDANSLGKWIYDWAVYHHGPASPIADMAGELWLLLIQLAGKTKRADDCIPRIKSEEDREMVDDFIESGDRLTDKLKRLIKGCETHMLKAAKKNKDTTMLDKNVGTEFVDSIFGKDRQLEQTKKLMASIRLWDLRFDANCEDILKHPSGGWKETIRPKPPTDVALVMDPVGVRTAFGLDDIKEDVAEEPEKKPKRRMVSPVRYATRFSEVLEEGEEKGVDTPASEEPKTTADEDSWLSLVASVENELKNRLLKEGKGPKDSLANTSAEEKPLAESVTDDGWGDWGDWGRPLTKKNNKKKQQSDEITKLGEMLKDDTPTSSKIATADGLVQGSGTGWGSTWDSGWANSATWGLGEIDPT